MNVTYPSTFPFLDADEVTAANLRAVIYNPSDTDGALSIINGNLDWRNLAANAVKREHVQRGALAEGWAASGTANLDYRYTFFADFETPISSFDPSADTLASGRSIPGGARTFYVNAPRAQDMIRVSWNVSWTNDNGWLNTGTTLKATHIYLKIIPRGDTNVDARDGQSREVNRTVNGTGDLREFESTRKSRFWSGHELVPLGTGWYTAALFVIQDKDIKQGRIWARSINVRRMTLKANG
jgi:hypothetical protein